ncbi:hypothetical protein CJU73_02935 [Pseudomonas fragi]|nr:hypothetical protein CJU73_02935 [Pseudomonas fragi]
MPAILTLRSASQTALMPSRASPLPPVCAEWCERRIPCGSWLACDTDAAVFQPNRVDAIAGKPAPTGMCRMVRAPHTLWELACLRCRHCGLSAKPR